MCQRSNFDPDKNYNVQEKKCNVTLYTSNHITTFKLPLASRSSISYLDSMSLLGKEAMCYDLGIVYFPKGLYVGNL